VTAGKGQYGGRRALEGTVVSDKTEKTVVVAVRSSVRHPLYKKIVRRVRKFMAHDDVHNAHMGDVVRIVESRPLSKRKRWRVVEVLERADLPEVAAESIDLELLGEVKTEAQADEEEAAPAIEAAPALEAAAEVAAEPEVEAPVAEEPPEVEEVAEVQPSVAAMEAEAEEPVELSDEPEVEKEDEAEAPDEETAKE
jgi:small subunit ribosomal protein S17